MISVLADTKDKLRRSRTSAEQRGIMADMITGILRNDYCPIWLLSTGRCIEGSHGIYSIKTPVTILVDGIPILAK